FSWTGSPSLSGILTVDTINEFTGAAGVTFEGVKALDSFLEFSEIADPGAGGANTLRVYAIDDGSGVTGLQITDSAGTDTVIVARTRAEVISLVGFRALVGSPILNTGSTSIRWQFDPDASEEILSMFTVPLDYVSGGTIRLYYTMNAATTGAVRWYVELAAVEEGENLNTAGTQLIINDNVQGNPVNLGVVDFDMSGAGETLAAGDCLNVLVGRSGGNPADTATGDAWLSAVTFVYTAFF
ncbi:hypothetical protein LCGC14_2955690, partial [marine sediment metagenome]